MAGFDPKWGLVPDRMKFCELLVSDPKRNQTKAYLKVYQDVSSYDIAASSAVAVMKSEKVRAYIAHLESKGKKHYPITADIVKRTWNQILNFDIRKLFDQDTGGLIPIHELDDDTAGALQSIEIQAIRSRAEHGDKEDKLLKTLATLKFKAYSKLTAADQAARHLGMFEKDNDQNAARPQFVMGFGGREEGQLPPGFTKSGQDDEED